MLRGIIIRQECLIGTKITKPSMGSGVLNVLLHCSSCKTEKNVETLHYYDVSELPFYKTEEDLISQTL